MKAPFKTPVLLALLVVTSFTSATVGALVALHISPRATQSNLQLKQLEIVDAQGTPRITLGFEHGQPSLRFMSAFNIPLIELTTPAYPQQNQSVLPSLQINDEHGSRAITLVANAPQHGLIAFNSPDREGKLLLGRFGITDDGTDTTTWGMQVSGRRADGSPVGHTLGMMSVDGKDKGFFWPGDPSPFGK